MILTLLLLSAAPHDAIRCSPQPLACNIFMEARGEGILGMAGIAFATLNRKKYPKHFAGTITKVVRKSQAFSWVPSSNSKQDWTIAVIKQEKVQWQLASTIAKVTYELSKHPIIYDALDITDGAIFYHAQRVKPHWKDSKYLTAQIGLHLFYDRDKNEWPIKYP